MYANSSKLEYLNLSGCNESEVVRGDDKMLAIIVAKSNHLRILDATATKLPLMYNIAQSIPWGHRLTALNLSVMGNNSHQYLIRYETIKLLVDKLRYLEDIILVGTDLCRKSVTHICTYLTETIKRVNFATERVRDSDINALANQCPNIT